MKSKVIFPGATLLVLGEGSITLAVASLDLLCVSYPLLASAVAAVGGSAAFLAIGTVGLILISIVIGGVAGFALYHFVSKIHVD